MNSRKRIRLYLIADFLSAAGAWTLFFIFRKLYIESRLFGIPVPLGFNERYFMGLVAVTLFWLFIYYLAGFYRHPFRKSLLYELGLSLLLSLTGVSFLFITLILNDVVGDYRTYYLSFSFLLLVHFMLSYFPRVLITLCTRRMLRQKKISFSTLIIGSNGEAMEIYRHLTTPGSTSGNSFTGFLTLPGKDPGILEKVLPCLGDTNILGDLLEKTGTEEIVIAVESHEQAVLEEILNLLDRYDVRIRIAPSLYDILTGKVRLISLFEEPLMELSRDLIPAWQVGLKRTMDVSISIISLIVLLPAGLLLGLLIRLDSVGPVLYSHERIGRYGKPFRLYKFRSMFTDAEENGPRLSSKDDPRVTRVGRFMRRTRLDEVPNFFNVLKGDMSLVGPRPERQYYIDQIERIAPEYVHLRKVKPGITSLGQVKFGYAESVDQMVQRMRYDLIYVENMSLVLDIKILAYTIFTILRRKGI